MDLVYLLAMLFAVPTFLYVATRYGAPGVWGLVVRGYQKRGEGVYRATVVPILKPGSAPVTIKAAAITCFLLGQMVVPGALAAFVGVIVTVLMLASPHERIEPFTVLLTLSSPSGLFIAARLLSAGTAMLKRSLDAAERARKVARVSLIHNGVLIAITLLVGLWKREDMPVTLLPIGYGTLSILQALLMQAAANDLDALDALDRSADAITEKEAPSAVSVG